MTTKKILICQHGGSGNHGCEALARTTIDLLTQAAPEAEIELYSYRREEDEKYLADLPKIHLSGLRKLPGKYSWQNLRYHWQKRVLHDAEASKIPLTAEFRQAVAAADLVIAIGGDNYCYNRGEGYYALDRYIKAQGKTYVLLGCSIEPADLPLGLARHLRLFDLITARESISHQAMLEAGLDNVALCPDSAFLLEPKKRRLPAVFEKKNTVGINVSPLIVAKETASGITMDNYRSLIKYILGSTKMQIALIPHVVWPDNDDRSVLQKLLAEFNNDGRICLVEDGGAQELKYVISQLRFFVGARTHATIAAYSSGVPTLTVGYSVKAKGIAKDLFGTYDNYVLAVQNLRKSDDLANAFAWLAEREKNIRQQLTAMMPAYTAQARGAALYLERTASGKELLLPATDAPRLAPPGRCTGCGLCAAACNEGCITMEEDSEGFLYPKRTDQECLNCGRCAKVCPARAGQTFQPLAEEAYAAYILDQDTRMNSSSGGIFRPLALDLLTHGGLVAGPVYDRDWHLKHALIDKAEDLPQLCGSKYLQSDMRDIFLQVQQALSANRPVLFSGTPCQTAAIRACCGDHDFLLTVAVACHGVPSPKVFRKYIAENEQKRGFRATSVNFKCKEQGWHAASTRIRFADGSVKEEANSTSPYMRLFLSNLSIRPSCSDCFAKGQAVADLIIGDFWGIEKFLPEMDDGKGVSVVLPQSEKGRAALGGITPSLNICKVDFASAWRYNTALVQSVPYNPLRQEFFAQLEQKSLRELAETLIPQPSTAAKLKRKAKSLLGGS